MQLLRLDSHKQIHAIKITVDPVERHPRSFESQTWHDDEDKHTFTR